MFMLSEAMSQTDSLKAIVSGNRFWSVELVMLPRVIGILRVRLSESHGIRSRGMSVSNLSLSGKRALTLLESLKRGECGCLTWVPNVMYYNLETHLSKSRSCRSPIAWYQRNDWGVFQIDLLRSYSTLEGRRL